MDGVDITIVEPLGRLVGSQGSQSQRPQKSWFKSHGRLISFILVVGLPTLLAGSYLVAFASDQYVSEAKFVVRGSSAQSPGVLGSLLETAGVSHASEDTYAVQDFIVSRDALGEMIKNQGLKEVFNRPGIDFLSRFPLIQGRSTLEHFYDYYKSHVEVFLDTSTGVSTLTVKTFEADDSQRIAQALLASAEELINRMNDRQRDNAMRDALKAVKTAEQRVEDVGGKIAEFRNQEALLDPNKQSVPMLQGINEMQTMLSRANLQLTQLVTAAPNSPLIADYKRRISALQAQISDAKTKITGTDQSLVPKITAYDMLTLQREFADRQLASATTSLEAARMQAERQQLYLDTIVEPNRADYPAYPKKIVATAIVFATFLGIYLMASLLIAGAREHKIV